MEKKISGFENYTIDEEGKVFSLIRNKYLKPNLVKGYYQVTLYKNGIPYWFKVHRLVAETFIPNPKNLPQINHINEIKTDNHISNLEWCDAAYNNSYGTRLDKVRKSKGNRVIQYDLNGNQIKVWDSCRQAEIELNIPHYVSACARGKRKMCGGFLWRYE